MLIVRKRLTIHSIEKKIIFNDLSNILKETRKRRR